MVSEALGHDRLPSLLLVLWHGRNSITKRHGRGKFLNSWQPGKQRDGESKRPGTRSVHQRHPSPIPWPVPPIRPNLLLVHSAMNSSVNELSVLMIQKPHLWPREHLGNIFLIYLNHYTCISKEESRDHLVSTKWKRSETGISVEWLQTYDMNCMALQSFACVSFVFHRWFSPKRRAVMLAFRMAVGTGWLSINVSWKVMVYV